MNGSFDVFPDVLSHLHLVTQCTQHPDSEVQSIETPYFANLCIGCIVAEISGYLLHCNENPQNLILDVLILDIFDH